MLSLLLFLPIFILPVSEMFHFVFPYTWQPPPCPDYSGQKCLGFSCDVINHHQYNFNSIRHCCHTSYNNIKSPSRNTAYVQYKTEHWTLTSRYFPGNYKNWHLGDKARLDTGNSNRVEIKESGQERGERREERGETGEGEILYHHPAWVWQKIIEILGIKMLPWNFVENTLNSVLPCELCRSNLCLMFPSFTSPGPSV